MTAREVALRALYRLEDSDLYADRVLHSALESSRLGRRDRALATQLVNGVTRWRRRLDWALDGMLTRGQIADLPAWIRNILRLGLYQVQFLDRIPSAAAVHQSVVLAKQYGHQGTVSLVNAVLRSATRSADGELSFPPLETEPVEHIGLRYSHPDWMVRRWLNRYGPQETLALCQANNRTPRITVRRNTLKCTERQLQDVFEKEGIATGGGEILQEFFRLESAGDVTRMDAFRQGWFQAQDESAGLAVILLAPRPDESILDLCSAPGGKTLHIADLMTDRGSILAVDRNRRRLGALLENCRRLEIRTVRPVVADGRCLPVRPMDRILVDAPCSGLGVLGRRADARWRRREEDISRLAILQLELLRSAAGLLKPGGILVYSTCTIEDQENEDVVAALVDERKDLVVEDAASFLPQEVVTEAGFSRTFPHRHGIDGTFAVRLRKKGQGVV